jgi:hypothetical protein
VVAFDINWIRFRCGAAEKASKIGKQIKRVHCFDLQWECRENVVATEVEEQVIYFTIRDTGIIEMCLAGDEPLCYTRCRLTNPSLPDAGYHVHEHSEDLVLRYVVLDITAPLNA